MHGKHIKGFGGAMGNLRELRRTRALLLVGSLIVVIVLCTGCFGASYSLDRDESIKTEWGAVIQYKIDDSWAASPSNGANSYSATASFHGDSAWLSFAMENADDSSYKYSSTSTYSGWLENQREFYTQSAADQAAWYKEYMSDSRYYDESKTNPSAYPDRTNYSMKEMGATRVGDVDFRLYTMKYTLSYSDEAYSRLKEEAPNTQQKQVEDHEMHYAIVKDGTHDFEVGANDERLLMDFMRTLQIKW